MMISTNKNTTQTSLDSWYQRESGIWEQFEAMHECYPDGFQGIEAKMEGTGAMHLAQRELKRYMITRRVKKKPAQL